jgi:hypothetical protein
MRDGIARSIGPRPGRIAEPFLKLSALRLDTSQ